MKHHPPAHGLARAGRLACLLGLTVLSCSRKDMVDQPSYRPLQESRFFRDGVSARPPVPGTVPFGARPGDPSLDGSPVREESGPITLAMLRKGRQRYEIYCSPCHGRTGEGNGMIVQRGFPAPPSFHSQRLRTAKDSHLYSVITHGFGRMYGYGYRVDPRDRIAVVAYIRSLQFSREAALGDVPDAARSRLMGGGPP
jgi:hypothetical protein